MKEKILAFLKTKIQGVQESYLLGVAEFFEPTIKEESQIATTLTDGIVGLIKLNAVQLQKEGDRRATEAGNTALKNFREKHGLDENGKPVNPDPDKDKDKTKDKDKPDPNEPEWFRTYRLSRDKELQDLKDKFSNQEKEKTSTALTDKVKGHEKLKGIPPSFLKGRNLTPESEDKVEQLATEIESDWNSFKQEQANSGVHIVTPPSSDAKVKEGEAIGKQIAEAKNAQSSEGVKGKTIM